MVDYDDEEESWEYEYQTEPDDDDEGDDPNRPPRPWYRHPLIFYPVIILAAMIVLGILMDSVIMPWYTKQGQEATVPKVTGLNKNVAIQTLKDSGYDPIQYEVRFSDSVAEGDIIRQTPEAEEITKPGTKVYLVISGGKDIAVVPSLIGKSLRDARLSLLKLNMTIGNVAYEYSDSAAVGTIFRQSPFAGAHTSASTQVSLTVSKGQMYGRVAVPDLTNITLADAITKLQALKLELGQVNYQDGIPADQIVDQYPKPGDFVMAGASVDVFINRGAPSTPPATE